VTSTVLQRQSKEKKQKRLRHRKVVMESAPKKKFSPLVRYIHSNGRYIFRNDNQIFGQAIFLTKLLSLEECQVLIRHMRGEQGSVLWEYIDDKTRGPKEFLITGRWTQQGHARPGLDHSYPAGKAGKKISLDSEYYNFNEPFSIVGERITTILQQYRPEFSRILNQLPKEEKNFGNFTFFMAAEGKAEMHKDQNDLISVLILLDTPANSGGGLEIGSSKVVFNWNIGDCIILDSSLLPHRTHNYVGEDNDRVVGIWGVHKSLLNLHEIDF